MNLELYHKEHCPFSARVREYIADQGLKKMIEYHDIREDEGSLHKLVSMNDDVQVPCLVVDGMPILESDDIIDWLKENLDRIIAKHSNSSVH